MGPSSSTSHSLAFCLSTTSCPSACHVTASFGLKEVAYAPFFLYISAIQRLVVTDLRALRLLLRQFEVREPTHTRIRMAVHSPSRLLDPTPHCRTIQ